MYFHRKKIISYSYNSTMSTNIAVKVVETECLNVEDTPVIILQSDLVTQYTSSQFEKVMKSKNIIHSFSRKGNP